MKEGYCINGKYTKIYLEPLKNKATSMFGSSLVMIYEIGIISRAIQEATANYPGIPCL